MPEEHDQPSLGVPALTLNLFGTRNRTYLVPCLVRTGKVNDEMAITASDARAHLFPLIQQVIDDHAPVRISSKAGDAVLMSADDYDSWQETIYLLRSPANARRLMEAVARDKAGTSAVAKTTEELESLAGEA